MRIGRYERIFSTNAGRLPNGSSASQERSTNGSSRMATRSRGCYNSREFRLARLVQNDVTITCVYPLESNMDATVRDIADFFRFALENSNSARNLVQVCDVIAWVDTLIDQHDVPAEWMLELSFLKLSDHVISALSSIPSPDKSYVGASVFVAYLNRLWCDQTITREDACHILWDVRDDLAPDYEMAAIVPSVTLEDADACYAHGIRNPDPYSRVDDALHKWFARFQPFEILIPDCSTLLGG